MHRVTISIDDGLAVEFDDLIKGQGYTSRSEAVRDLVRSAVERERSLKHEATNCVASLSYVYDHHVRALGQRLVEIQHDHHDIVVSTTHVHLDHNACLETSVLKGPTAAVRALSDAIRTQRGVRFAEINVISVEMNGEHDAHNTPHVHGLNGHSSPLKG